MYRFLPSLHNSLYACVLLLCMFLLHCAQRTCTYGCWQCNSECRQIASGLSRSNSAHPLLTRNSSQKAGKTLSEVIKGVPLYLNSIQTLFIQKKRKVGRPKKAKFTDENLRLTGKNHHPTYKKPRTTYLQHSYNQSVSNLNGNIGKELYHNY